jgi:hypothetical protein
VVIRLEILRVALEPWRLLLTAELELQRVDVVGRDLVLDLEHVLHLAVVALGPDLIAVGRVVELRGDAEVLACGADAAFQHRLHLQRLADPPHVTGLALELKGREASGHAQAPRCASSR